MKKLVFFPFLLLALGLQGQSFWFKNHGGTGNDEALDITRDDAGNLIVTGYFTQNVTFGSTVLSTYSISDIFIAKYSPAGTLLWARQAGGNGADRGYSVRTDGAGYIYVTGYFNATAHFGPHTLTAGGSQDVFVVKLSPSGSFVWARKFGGPHGDTGYGVSADNSGNVIVTGQFKGTADFGSGYAFTGLNDPFTGLPAYELFVAKLDSSGTTEWAKAAYTKYDDRGLDVDCDNAGNIYVVGQFSDTITIDVTHYNSVQNAGFLLKLDPAGSELVFRKMSAVQTLLYSLEVDNAGQVNLCGEFQGNLAIDVSPVAYVTTTRPKNILVARFDASCNLVWASHAGSESDVSAKSIVTDNSGNVLVAGTFKCRFDDYGAPYGEGMFYSTGYRDVFAAKYDNTGQFVWAKNCGGPQDDFCSGISLSPTGLPVLAGGMNERFSFVWVPSITGSSVTTVCPSIEQGPIYTTGSFPARNIFVGSFMQYTTYILDVFNRYPACDSSLLYPRLRNAGPDTMHTCVSGTISASTRHFSPCTVGACFDYTWQDGSHGSTFNYSTTGWYSVKTEREDGCYENTDSLYIWKHDLPPAPLISDDAGINTLSPPDAIDIKVCGADSILLTASSVVLEGSGAGWSSPEGFAAVNDSVILVLNSGTFHFLNKTSYGCVRDNEVTVLMDTFALHDTLTPFLVFGSAVNDTITICTGASISITCRDTGYFSGYHMPYKTVKWFYHTPTGYINSTYINHINTYYPGGTSGWFRVYAQLINVCGDTVNYHISDSVYIKVNPKPSFSYTLVPDTYVCPSDTITHVFYSNADSQAITGGPYLAYSDSLITTLGTGMVSIALWLTDTLTGCSNNHTLTFNINPYAQPGVEIHPADGIVCPGDSVLLTADDGLTWSWVGPEGDSLGSAQQIYVNVPGFYHCIITDLSGCPLTSNTLEAKEYNTPYIFVTPSSQICPGGETTIQAVAASSALINWLPPLSGSGPSVTVDSAGIYYCNITLCGITTYDSVAITEAHPPAYILAADTLMCPGDSLLLTANGGMSAYLWTPGETEDASVFITAPGTYYLQTTDANGCNGHAAVVIHGLPQPEPATVADTTVCAGSTVLVHAAATAGISWYTSAVSPVPFYTGNVYLTPPVTGNTTYYLETQDSLCPSVRVPVTISVHSGSVLPVITGDTVLCGTDTLLLHVNPVSGVQYNWVTPFGLVPNTTELAVPVADSSADGYYGVWASDAWCSSDTAMVQVSWNEVPSVTVSASSSVFCSGDSVLMTATPGYTIYEWSVPSAGNDSLWVSSAGTYSVTVHQSGCTSTSGSVTIGMAPAVAGPLVTGAAVCPGQTAALTATGSPVIQWFDSSGTWLFTGSTFITPPLSVTTVYFARAVSPDGCLSNPVPVTAIVSPDSAATLFFDPVCMGGDLHLYSNMSAMPVSFYWSGPAGFSSVLAEPVITGTDSLQQGWYHMVYSTPGCVSDTASVWVNIHPNPLAQVLEPLMVACENDSVTLHAAPGAGYLYTWTLPGGMVSMDNPLTVLALPADSGTVWLQVADSLGCTASSVCTLNIKPLPSLNFELTGILCEGQTIYLSAQTDSLASGIVSGPGGYSGTQSLDSIVAATGLNSGIYTFTAVLNGCADSVSLLSEVVPYPEIWLGNDTTICEGASLSFVLDEPYAYNWYNGATDASQTVADSGWIWVTATTGPGCSVTDSLYLVLENCTAALPNIFTPNGDGMNDYFTVVNPGVVNLELHIFNRYGSEVFSTVDPAGRWDGRNEQGNLFAAGVYFYTAIVENELGQKVVLHGHLQLSR